MILEELTLRGWRQYRESRHFVFDAGLNLIEGPNEAGKSTLLEALTRGLFDRHSSRTRDLKSIPPVGSSLAPEVELILGVSGRRWKAHKRFLREPEAQLWLERGGAWQLDHEGDKADQELRDLLRGGRSRGGSKPEHRGLAQALWYLQGEDALPKGKGWEEAVDEGLRGSSSQVLRTHLEVELLARLQDLVGTVFTPSGRISSTGELGRLQKEVEQLEKEVVAAREKLQRLSDYRQTLSELESESRGLRDRITSVSERITNQGPEVQAARELLKDRTRIEAELTAAMAAERDHQTRLERAQARARTLQAERETLIAEERSLQEKRAEESRLEARLEDLQRKLGEAEKTVATRETRLEEVRAESEALRLRDELSEVRGRLRTMNEEDHEIRDLESALTNEAPVSPESLVMLQMLERRVEALETVREERALEVRVERLKPEVEIAFEPAPESPGDELRLLEPTTLTIADDARIHIAAGSRRIDEALETARSQRRDVLSELGVEGLDEASRRRARRVELEQQLEVLRRGRDRRSLERSKLVERETGLEESLGRATPGAPQALLPGFEEASPSGTLASAQHEVEMARAELEQGRALIEETRRRREAVREESTRIQQRVSDHRFAIAKLEGEQKSELGGGCLDDLAAEVAIRAAAVSGIRQKLSANQATDPERVIADFSALETERGGLERSLRSLEESTTDRKARRNELLDLGVRGRLGEIEAMLEERRRRLEVIGRRSEAARLLSQMATAWDERSQNVLVAPVSELVDRWWRRVMGPGSGRVVLAAGLMPVGISDRDDVDLLDFGSLSFGTAALVVVLLRLAIGFALSTEERHLVVLDDRLVDVDKERIEGFCEVLTEASERCQVILTTCHGDLYQALPAHRIVLARNESVGAEIG